MELARLGIADERDVGGRTAAGGGDDEEPGPGKCGHFGVSHACLRQRARGGIRVMYPWFGVEIWT